MIDKSRPMLLSRHVLGLALLTAVDAAGAPVIDDVHVTQSIENPAGVAFIANRSTAVRAVVTSSLDITEARVRVRVDGSFVPPAGGLPPDALLPWSAPAVPDLDIESHTLNFELPFLVPASADVDFIVSVEDTNGDSDQLGAHDLAFEEIGWAPEIYYVRVHFDGSAPDSALLVPGTGDAFLRASFPVPDSMLYRESAGGAVCQTDEGTLGVLEEAPDGLSLLSKLEAMRTLGVIGTVGPTSRRHVYGFLDGIPFGGPPSGGFELGRAVVGGRVAYGNSSPEFHQRTFAYLIGQNRSIPAPVDLETGAPGWDVGGSLVDNPTSNHILEKVKPSTLQDFMHGSATTVDAWVSPETYEHLISEFSSCNALTTDGLWLLGSTTVGDVFTKGFTNMTSGQFELTQGDPTGDYWVHWMDEFMVPQSLQFSSRSIADHSTESPSTSGAGIFSLFLPRDPNADLVSGAITDAQGDTLWSIEDSIDPVVTITSPAPGAVLEGAVQIEWDAIDQDSQSLIQHVQYRASPGNWFPIAVNVPEGQTSVTFITHLFPPTPALQGGVGRIRVVLSDGTTTVLDTVHGLTVISDPSVSVPESAPSVPPLRVQVRPNPFRASTTLRFETAYGSFTNVRIFDIGGRIVRELYAGELDPGAHAWRWDGHSDADERAAAGIYFVEIETAKGKGTSRIVKIE